MITTKSSLCLSQARPASLRLSSELSLTKAKTQLLSLGAFVEGGPRLGQDSRLISYKVHLHPPHIDVENHTDCRDYCSADHCGEENDRAVGAGFTHGYGRGIECYK